MKRRFGFVGVLLVVALVSVGCSGLSPAPFRVTAGFTPTSLGFEVDDEGGIEVAAHTVTFVSQRGSVGGVVTGYEMQYFDAAGMPLIPGTRGLVGDASLSHIVPPGVRCIESDPCSFVAPDAVLENRASEPMENVITLPGPVAVELMASGAEAARADGVFFITTDNGRNVEVPFSVPVTYPVAP